MTDFLVKGFTRKNEFGSYFSDARASQNCVPTPERGNEGMVAALHFGFTIMTDFSIRIDSGDLIFSAAHFITFGGGGCEALHGHDYRVKAELFGPLGANEYLVDFVLVHEGLKAIVKELDHRTLLPAKHDSIAVKLVGEECVITHGGRRWVLPRDNCRVLPIGNTTTEMFARYIGQRLIEDLIMKRQLPVTQISIEVGEYGGFTAVCRLEV
jgi:6-pyruvoyltetrahydropterin/6-carboxytetrahydropterin synthase